MGLVIGQKNPKHVNSEEIGQEYRERMNNKTAAAEAQAEEQARLNGAGKQNEEKPQIPTTVEEEEAVLRKNDELLTHIMGLEKSEQPQALRDSGFPLLAEKKEKEIAEVAARAKKLADIMAMPEEERVGALLDAGFNEEAAAENKRLSLAKKWSALIILLGEKKISATQDPAIYPVLEKASNYDLSVEERLAILREGGLDVVADCFEKVVGGEDVEAVVAAVAPAPAAEAPADNAAAGDSNSAGTEAPEPGTDAAAAAENADAAPAGEPEKKKVGRPAGSTTKK